MKIALINASPKPRDSASGLLLEALKPLLGDRCDLFEARPGLNAPPEIMERLSACDALLFASPLYVDGLPSHLLRYLELWEGWLSAHPCPDMRIYAIVNCGFYEGEQNAPALEMLEHWCLRAGLVWGQGIGVGAGPMLAALKNVPLGQGPKKSLGAALEALAENTTHGGSGANMFVTANFLRFAYRLAAQSQWRRQGRRNGLSVRDLFGC